MSLHDLAVDLARHSIVLSWTFGFLALVDVGVGLAAWHCGFAARAATRVRAMAWGVFLFVLAWPVLGALPWPAWCARTSSPLPDWPRVPFDATTGVPGGAGDATPAVILVLTWALGALCAGTLVLAGARRARRRFLAGRAAETPAWLQRSVQALAGRAGLRRVPRVRVDAGDVGGPAWSGAVVVGAWRPTIVVATDLAARGPSVELEHVLLHELAHVARRDAWSDVLWVIARCVYWFHPCVHFAASRAALAREMASDERAAAWAGGDARAYRRTLLELARPLASAPRHATAYFGRPAHVLARLDGLSRLEVAVVRAPRRFDVVSVGAFVVLTACCWPSAARPDAVQPRSAVADVVSDDVSDGAALAWREADGCLRKRYLLQIESARLSRAESDHP